MAAFTQRESGWWQAKVRRKGFPTQSKTFATKVEAEKWARKIESGIDVGAFESSATAERMTVANLIATFEAEYAPHHYRVREDKSESWRYQCARIKEALGSYSLAALDAQIVAKYRDDRLKGAGGRPKVSESTVRKEIYLLSKVLRFAETEKAIFLPRGNPVARIRKPSDGRARDRRLSEEEWAALEAELKKSRNKFLYLAVQLAVETAMRQGEILGLSWGCIDLDRRVAFLEVTKNGEARAVPLSSRAVATLQELAKLKKEGDVVVGCGRVTLYAAFRDAVKRAGIQNFTFHDLRHEALSRLAGRGDFSILELAAVSGHKTLQMLKRYTHLRVEELARKMG